MVDDKLPIDRHIIRRALQDAALAKARYDYSRAKAFERLYDSNPGISTTEAKHRVQADRKLARLSLAYERARIEVICLAYIVNERLEVSITGMAQQNHISAGS